MARREQFGHGTLVGVTVVDANRALHMAPDQWQIVSHEQNGQVAFALQFQEQFENALRGRWINTGGRFVENQDLRLR